MKNRTVKKKGKTPVTLTAARVDPTGTAGLVRTFCGKLNRKFDALRKAVYQATARDDVFGLGADELTAFLSGLGRTAKMDVPLPTANAGEFAFHTDDKKVEAFQRWLESRYAELLTGADDEEAWRLYVEDGYRRGAGQAWADAKEFGASPGPVSPFYTGTTQEDFLRSAFGRPEAVGKVKLLAGRAFDDLENVTSHMSTLISRSLVDGLVQGKNPRDIARDMVKAVDVGRDRALLIARTELIRAHSQGALDTYEAFGIDRLGLRVEWLATGDGRTCPVCASKAGRTYTVEQARGLIPIHPNCRCSFIPSRNESPTANAINGHQPAQDRGSPHVLNHNAVCVNCGGKGGKPGPCRES